MVDVLDVASRPNVRYFSGKRDVVGAVAVDSRAGSKGPVGVALAHVGAAVAMARARSRPNPTL